jgi:hypothetical protein
MANEDDPPRRWGHLKSPFFQLPPEVRNSIYREVFAGSKVDLVHDPPVGVDVVPIGGRRSVFQGDTSTHHILLACFQVYLDANATYWSHLVVRNSGLFSFSYFLNRIPAAARPYIQHLRKVCDNNSSSGVRKWMQGLDIEWHLLFAESLASFQNLKSYSIPTGWNIESPMCRETRVRYPNLHVFSKTSRMLEAHDLDEIFPEFGGYCDYFWERVSSWQLRIINIYRLLPALAKHC